MEIREAIIHALDGDAILFIGSGFSLGAINEGNKKIETATPLAHKLLAECDFEEKDFTNDLGIASRIYQSAKSEIDLIEFLRKEYTAIDVTPEQEIIAQINWQRIYTPTVGALPRVSVLWCAGTVPLLRSPRGGNPLSQKSQKKRVRCQLAGCPF